MLQDLSRRCFLKNTSSLLLSALLFSSFRPKKYVPKLSFSTLGCPDWDFDTIINFAAENNYNGIEFRGIQKELDLTKCPSFSSDENIKTSIQKLNSNNLKVVDLGSSTSLHLHKVR